jgi:hypothetical protein
VRVHQATGELQLLVKVNVQGQGAEARKSRAVRDLKQLSGGCSGASEPCIVGYCNAVSGMCICSTCRQSCCFLCGWVWTACQAHLAQRQLLMVHSIASVTESVGSACLSPPLKQQTNVGMSA